MQLKKQNGFTLVEIAIVLVIVGLLIGGVLKGREMITNSNLKRIDRDRSGIVAALQAYQDRYRVLPGDDNLASARFAVGNIGAHTSTVSSIQAMPLPRLPGIMTGSDPCG